MVQKDEELARQFSKKRSDIARGMKPVLVDEDIKSSGQEVEAEEVVAKPRATSRKQKKKPTREELFDIFSSLKFLGTRYPHRGTMEALGIARDTKYMFEM